MRRLLFGLILSTAIVASLAAVAAAVDREFVPKTAFKVRFTADFKGGEPVSVEKFRFKNLKMSCDQGKVFLSAKGFQDMGVIDDEFGATVPGTKPDHEVVIDGKFNDKATKARGSVSANGDFENDSGGGNFTNCAGSKDYEVKRD